MPETTAPTVHECEVFLLIDEDGDYVVAKDKNDLDQLYIDDISDNNGINKRIIGITVRVPAPLPVSVVVEVPEEPSIATVSVK